MLVLVKRKGKAEKQFRQIKNVFRRFWVLTELLIELLIDVLFLVRTSSRYNVSLINLFSLFNLIKSKFPTIEIGY